MIENQHASFYLQSVPVSDAYVGKSRLEVLRGYCENKKVLHIGCVDYPVTQLADNLHVQLAPFCAILDGYDIHTEVYPILKPYIQNGRFLYSLEEAGDYDVVIIPEVLEHIGDVPKFLDEMAKISTKKFLITVPDLFQCFNRHFEYSGNNQVFLEAIHPDHNCWYSPYTITNTIKKYTPWQIASIHFFNRISLLVVADSATSKQSPANEPIFQTQQLTQPKKILLAVDFFWPSVGGLEKQTQEIATHLSTKGYQVTIATGELPDRKEHKYQNSPIISLSRASVAGQPYPKATDQLRHLIASGDYDACILLADPLNWVIWSLESGTFPPQTRIIVQPIINDQGYALWRNHAAFRQRLSSTLKKADHLIAFNPHGPDAHFLSEEHLPVEYIPNACSPIESTDDFRLEMGIEKERFLLLHIANLFPVKNHLGLIDALAGMPDDWLLVMIGHPADADYSQAVIKHITGIKNIKLILGLPHAKAQAAIKAADVILLSSLGEGFPTTILEAMAGAKPWLATPTCGAANQLTGGLIAPIGQFLNQLTCLERSPDLRRRLGDIGHAHWRQCFNWETVITRWEEIIQQGRIKKALSPSAETVREQQAILDELQQLLEKAHHENPLVSVIITTFNRPALLLDAIHSVLAQTYRSIEIIVVNDCGQPVESALATLETQVPISSIRHGVNRGLSAARNSGIALARGEIICFLDDDDRFLPHHLQTVVTALREPGTDLVYTDAVYVREQLANGERHELARGEPFKGIPYDRAHLLVENFVPVNTWALRRTLALRAGPFEESYTALEDWEFLLRLTALTEPKPIAQTTVEVRIRTDLSEHMSGRERERFLPLYRQIYQRHPTLSANVQAGREQMLTALAGEQATAHRTAPASPALPYPAWRERQRWPATATARLAEQVAPLVEAGAGVHIVLVATTNDNAAVADTLDTLATQATPGWRLTVISPYPCPDPLFTTLPALAWLQLTTAETLPALLNQAVAAASLDWLMVCVPGIRFEPTFAALTLAAAAKHPAWRCLYFDEDRLDGTGQPSDPHLKPDINPELLYGSAYVGHAVLVHRALWPTLDHRLAAWPRAFAFDAALRALEMAGEAAIGHIDELAVSLPVQTDGETADWLPMAQELLSAHLARRQEPAALYPGLLPDTLFVDYPLARHPLVSIILLATVPLEQLRLCLDHLLTKTEYRNFEVWVTGNAADEAATAAYLDDLSSQDARIKHLSGVVADNPSAIRNQVAALATGEFLLLLDSDTVAVQPNWLDRLLAHGLRTGVGVVGCRLLSPQGRVRQAGLILGLSGGAEPIGCDTPIATLGHQGRAQQTQNFSAVSAACLLIRRDLYREIGGLDEHHFPDQYAEVDLCLQVRGRGLQVVWTPFATLLQQTGNTPSAHQDTTERAALALTRRWLAWQAADPAYNRRLSLAQPDWSLDNTLMVPWNPQFETLPCVLAAPYDGESTSHHRLRDPLAALETSGQTRHALLPDYDRLKPEFLDPVALERTGMAVFLFQDAFGFDRIAKLRAALPHRRIVLTQNDAMARIAARTHIPCTPEDADTLQQAEQYLRQTLAFCDRLIVADADLAEAFRDMIGDIRIVPNYLPRQRWENLSSRRGRGSKPRIGWVNGVGQSTAFTLLRTVIEATRDAVDWILLGSCPENIRSLLSEHHPVVPFQDYPARLASLDLDLAVIPPASDPFTATDNRLRLLEYGILGWPTLCCADDGYDSDAPISRLPNAISAWVDAIRERAHDLAATWREGDLLQTWVRTHRMLEDHLDEWHDALFAGFDAPPPSLSLIPHPAELGQIKDRNQPPQEKQESSVVSSAHLPVSTVASARLEEAVPASPVTVTISVVICSVDNARFSRIARQYHELLTDIPHEIIRIDDASSLCEGYNRGIARSRGDYLIFSHDDLEIWTPDFGQRLLKHLERCDVVGVAGTNRLTDTGGQTALWKYTSWGAAGLGHVFGRIVQRQDDAYAVVVYGTPTTLVEGIQALDGAFIAARRPAAETLGFDAETFDGFHLYDLDFSYRAFRHGFRLGVFTDIAILHESAGDYDAIYFNYHRRFLQKFAGELPKFRPRPWQHAFMVFECPEDVLAFYQGAGEAPPLMATTTTKTGEPSGETGPLSDNALYRRWCERQQVGEGWAEIVGERMVKHWQTQPTFHLVIWCEPSQTAALADTLESLGQQLYGHWGTSVLAPFDCPEGAFTELAHVEWVKVAADADAALRQVLDASALDWFALLEAGDRLAPHALLKIADYSNRYPDWRFIYLDEDQLDLRGERRDPLFRPEFDPDLLLGTHYLGDCCLMRRDSVLVDGDLSYLPGVTTFQAALTVWQRHGAGAIGHLADVLYHRAATRLPAADSDAIASVRRRLVMDYLTRHHIAATVEATLLPGAWRLVYQHAHRPKVSIIILAKDALDRLDRCLRKLLAKTAYPDYEVVVVDCGSEAEDTFDLYAELAECYPDRFRYTVASGPLSVAAYRNQGAREAHGDVLVFLTGSALVVQADWIERLLNHALRATVGIVGARLTTPDATRPFVYGTAQLLGLHGLTGPLFAGLGLKAPGPLGRAQVDQTVSAVSANCLMIRREVFDTLGGFDPAFTLAHADTDLCLRAAAQGYRTLWTPFANLAWLGEYPLATGGGDHHSAVVVQARSDAERLFEHWLPQLATDPAYNRNLSLVEPHRVEVDLAPGWDTAFHDRPRVLGFPADETGCALYRIYAPLWLLEHQAQAECTLIRSGARPPELTELEQLAPDTVFYQGMIADLGIAAMRQYRRFHRSFKVFDLDDLKHNVPDANSLKERLVRDVKHRHRQALAQCDRLIVSTEPLAEACRPWIADIRVVPNRLERARWGHLQNRRRVGPKLRVGWAGAQQHHGDLAFISEVVKQTATEVDWIFFGMCLDDVRPYVKEVHGWVHLNDYPAKLASLDLDLAVAPLELHPFNEAKSNLRILEHGILGRPMVCTDIYPYQNAPVQRVTNDTAAWVAAIRERVHDLDAAEHEGDALRAWVLAHYILDDHTHDWLSALQP